jgi:hypothetical protein
MVTTAEYQHIVTSQMSEKDWQEQVIELAHTLGYVTYHTYDSRRCEPGLPDLFLLRMAPPRFVVIELKTTRGRITKEQRIWLNGLRAAGVEAYIFRPHQWNELVEELKR